MNSGCRALVALAFESKTLLFQKNKKSISAALRSRLRKQNLSSAKTLLRQ